MDDPVYFPERALRYELLDDEIFLQEFVGW